MDQPLRMLMIACLMIPFAPEAMEAQPISRAEVPEHYTWRLEDLYPSDAAWRETKTRLLTEMEGLLRYKGRLTTSAKDLYACLELNSTLSKEFARLYAYASMKSDIDTRNAEALAMKQEMTQFATRFNSKAAFIEPELVALDAQTIRRMIREEPGLEVYRFYLQDLLRRKAHTLSEKEEKILAEAGILAVGPSQLYTLFANAELPYPEITLSDGRRVRLNQTGYSLYRALPNREDRERVFQAFWSTMGAFRQTLGAMLNANIQKDLFYTRVRGYPSCLHAALDVYNIPVEVYHNLIENVHTHLGAFHRYLKLRQRLLGVDTLKYSDLYAPVVKGIDLTFTFEEAKTLVLEALAPLGKTYTEVVRRAFDDRWIDVYPTEGKRSGAYSNGSAYDVHPYILLNFNGKYDDVSTLAHELGHALHSYLSNRNQPYPLAEYSIFVAEIASTLNEALLYDWMLKTVRDDETRLSLLMEYLDGIKGTLFRQTQFAEFELRIHGCVERDVPLTGDRLTELYTQILEKYYGADQGITQINDEVKVEWSFIPHFYYNYYVYQYATSFTASTTLAEKILRREPGSVERTLKFLSAGGSQYPIDLLREAGVDMTSREPFERTIQAMNRTMDEIERILNKRRPTRAE